MNEPQAKNKADALALDVLTLARNTLLVNLRFLDVALSQFMPEFRENIGLATDGQAMYYDTLHVLRGYRDERTLAAREYLHLVLHCVFQHMYHNKDVDRKLWDLSCDIALEHAISQLKLMAVTVEREQKQRDITEKLKRQAGMLTAGKIYRWLLTHPLGETEYETWRRLFFADGHDLWYENGETIQTQRTGLEDWQEIARRMQVDMETFARRQGDKAEAIMQNLREVNRETYDYAGFLRKFATRGEPMRTNPDEFDYIFYTYGMRLYENMPLIEPLEYRDIKNIREFVVALQFSGLLSLKEVRGFIRKTYEVLRATDSPKSQVRLHFLLCDGANAEYVHIRDETELETLLQRLKIRDETDFRPAFIHADGMLQRGEFRNLRGLIYLTDGAGAFPRAKPNYDAVFVFVNDDYGKPDVPPWAIRIVLQRDEIDYDKQQ